MRRVGAGPGVGVVGAAGAAPQGRAVRGALGAARGRRGAGAKLALAGLAKRLGLDATAVRALRPTGEVEHVLSHRRMRVAVSRGALGRRKRWAVPSDEYEAVEVVPLARLGRYAQASLVGKILAAAGWP